MTIQRESTTRARAALGAGATSRQVAEAASQIELAILDERWDAAMPGMPPVFEVTTIKHPDGRREKHVRVGDRVTITNSWPARS